MDTFGKLSIISRALFIIIAFLMTVAVVSLADNALTKSPLAALMPSTDDGRTDASIRLEAMPDLDSMLNLVSQDSIYSYVHQFEAFIGRVPGSQPSRDAAEWIVSKFAEFGYDSVVVDTFLGDTGNIFVECRNILVEKPGTEYFYHKLVMGAHLDIVPESPGANDDGSGVAGVLEMARVLHDFDTRLNLVFAIFDVQEYGLDGSERYVHEAIRNGDSILVMMTLDQIGHYENQDTATVSHGVDSSYASLWKFLADSIDQINLKSVLQYSEGKGDYVPFHRHGFKWLAPWEYIPSTVYHTPSDSTPYMNFDYLTRMIKGNLAFTCYVDQNIILNPGLWITYSGGAPEILFPGNDTTIDIYTDGFYGGMVVPVSESLHYAVNGGTYTTMPLAHIAGDHYQVTFPALEILSHIDYYVSAEEATIGVLYYPNPLTPHMASAAIYADTVFEDNFEMYKGWLVSGDALHGQWERAEPFSYMWGSNYEDYDHSGKCYVTGVYHGSNVDAGTTMLKSPAIDLSGGDGLVEYARWYCNDSGGAPNTDIFTVKISGDNGVNWTTTETVGPVEQSSGGWYIHRFWASDFVAPGSQTRIRFEASDLNEDSQVEAAVDAFRVTYYSCGPDVEITTAALPVWTCGVPYSYQLESNGGYGVISWEDKFGDLTGSGLLMTADGLISGIPDSALNINMTAIATDEIGRTDEKQFSFLINPALEIMTEEIPRGTAGAAYSFQMTSAGGTGDILWSDPSMSLNGTGLSLLANGSIAGTPVDSGNFEVVFEADDAVGAAVAKPFTLRITIQFVCGDVNHDGSVNILDITYLISYLYKSGPAPIPVESADVDGNYKVNLLDITKLINYLYKSGGEPICP